MKDHYIYSDTEILINKFNIKNADELERVEKEYTSIGLAEIKEGYVKGIFDIEHFKNIHKHIFGDVYPWAGEFRTVNIFKSEEVLGGLSVDYSKYGNIENDTNIALKKLNSFNWTNLSLDDRAHEFTKIMSDVWTAHGFREGNTRTTVTFFSEFARAKGFPLNEEILSKNSVYVRRSLVASAFEDELCGKNRNFSYLERIIKDSMQSGSTNYSNIKNKYVKDIPGIKYASKYLLDNLKLVNDSFPERDFIPLKEIKALYNKIGLQLDKNSIGANEKLFHILSDALSEVNKLNNEYTAKKNEKTKELKILTKIDMEL